MSNPTKKYLVGGVLVEAVKSEGGGFYELTVLATGDKQRYLADVFEAVAKPASEIHLRILNNEELDQ
jgi:hypothetical protein